MAATSRLAPLVVVLLIGLPLIACRGSNPPTVLPTRTPGVGTRPFLMGVSSVPTDPSDESYRSGFRFAGQAGDIVLIQRAPPWEDFLPGAKISERTERLTRFEKEQAKANNLRLFLAIDPTDPDDRGRLAAVPDELRGRDFSDNRVRAAFIAYAKYLALNYKPDYLALGVEVDMYFRRRDSAAFQTFLSLYFEAYDAVKQVSPDTLVFPTFQYEDLTGRLPVADAQSQPLWPLVNRFEPKIDLIAVSTFPGFVFPKAADIAPDYYRQLSGQFSKPLAFVSSGWSSQSEASAAADSDGEQAAFMERLLADARWLAAKLVIWYLGRDSTVKPAGGFTPLASAGLIRPDGAAKPAWGIWLSELSARPPRQD